jgi:thioredoxin reductase (NADPH)
LKLDCSLRPYAVDLCHGHAVRARSIIIATGAEYRQLAIENASRFLGTGIYYAATATEVRRCEMKDVIVVGGGNSAGQAAIYLAGKCHHVHLLVRAGGLADTMSSYLIRRIEEAANITLRTNTEIASLEGAEQLERVVWKTRPGNVLETHQIGHVFLMTGAVPSTDWLKGCIALNDKGFVRTGPELTPADMPAANGSPMRPLQSFETNWPGVFAVGDVRCGSVKRVAAAVGEGSACVQQVHQALRD